MIKVFSAQDLIEVMFWANFLQQHNIRCQLKNEFAGSAIGELPPIECWPELWVDDENLSEAKKLLASEPLAADKNKPAWQCQACGETSDGQFSQCWNCQTDKP